MKFMNLEARAGKLLNAVASIGYDTEVALCDLIDNSLDACANKIIIKLDELIEEGETTNIITSYSIIDNGSGMNEDGIRNALTLGSEREYPSGSLGKFGLGLKSAGLSLGDRIVLLTKRADMPEPICAILSVKDVEESGDYRIQFGGIPEDYLDIWTESHIDDHGTILIVDECDAQLTLSKFTEYFSEYCGIVYHRIIEKTGVNFFVNNQKVTPIDPLFQEEAERSGSLIPESWDGKKPHILLEEQALKLDDNTSCKISATHLVHPPSFEKRGDDTEPSDVENAREKYMITPNSYTRKSRNGFYVYRNDRVIVQAERFHGLVSNETTAWAFRARLMFDESADSVLSLDVKKRHLKLPASARQNLKLIVGTYQTKSIKAWKLAGSKHQENKSDKETVGNQGLSNTEVNNLDYNPGGETPSEDESKQKIAVQNKISNEALKIIRDKTISREEIVDKAASNHSIIYVEGIKGNPMWLPYADTKIGKAEVLLNTQHSWIDESVKVIGNQPKSAMLLYQLFAILSRAELEVRSTPWKDVTQKQVDITLDKFRKKVSMIAEDAAESIDDAVKKIKQESTDDGE